MLKQASVRYPGLPLILYGHSLGGILALHYGLKRKPDVKGVLVTSPALHSSLEQQAIKVLAAKILGALVPKMTLASGLNVNAISHDLEVIKAYNNDPLVHNRISVGFGKVLLQVCQYFQITEKIGLHRTPDEIINRSSQPRTHWNGEYPSNH